MGNRKIAATPLSWVSSKETAEGSLQSELLNSAFVNSRLIFELQVQEQ